MMAADLPCPAQQRLGPKHKMLCRTVERPVLLVVMAEPLLLDSAPKPFRAVHEKFILSGTILYTEFYRDIY